MKSLIAILTFCSLNLFAQSDPIVSAFPDNLVNTKTKEHKRITSTRLFAIIPEHFSTNGSYLWPAYYADINNKHFIGFKVTYSKVEERGLSGKSWSEVKEDWGEIRPRELWPNNFIVEKELTINGYEGRYREYSERDKHHLHLYFGNEDFVVKIEARTPLNSVTASAELRKIMLSVYYNEENTLGLINFPDTIITQKTKNHQRIKGTKLFAIIPQHYTKSEKNDKCFYDKREGYGYNICLSENSYAQLIAPPEIKNRSWNEIKDWSNESPTGAHSALFLKKEIQLNRYDGLYIESFSVLQNDPDYYRFNLIFGHGDFTASISGGAPIDSLNAKNEIIEIMKTVFFDKDFYQDELTDASFEFDRSITGFKYVGYSDQFSYSEYERPQSKKGSFMSFYPFELDDYSKERILNEFEYHTNFGAPELENVIIKENKINYFNAIIRTAEAEFHNKETLFYHAMLYDDSHAILMSGYGDLKNREEWLSKFQKTLKSVKFK